jgi:alkylation response protein AidB-like acyl-CoA dehydrogenase
LAAHGRPARGSGPLEARLAVGGERLGRGVGPGQGGTTILTLAVDEGTRHAPAQIALEAAKSGSGFRLSGTKTLVPEGAEFLHTMSNELIQIHGGIGMTDEFDAGFYLKPARAVESLFGSRAFHRDRYATLLGF